ncbi:hypothetical protein [Sphingobium sp. Sx8-8]|uniref:hypothetical protein n=1 Tax=Sphingobium sp. Sx8-8 TaxID=2933617 RepID=UPI001F57BD7E|nr:hypothetical protein [Sphingobium sp. Sx8-8]
MNSDFWSPAAGRLSNAEPDQRVMSEAERSQAESDDAWWEADWRLWMAPALQVKSDDLTFRWVQPSVRPIDAAGVDCWP